jgi:hypothetical protein
VPWLQALAERASGGAMRPSIVEIGQAGRVVDAASPAEWKRVDRADASSAITDNPSEPGIYEVVQNGIRREVALLVPSVESQIQPLPLDTWEQLGVPLRTTEERSSARTSAVAASGSSAAMLESRQQLWRWLLWVAVGLLALESVGSFLVSRRRTSTANVPTG